LCLSYMIEFESRPLKKMTIEEIKQHFSYDALLAGRLDDLVANHYVVREGEQYRLAPKGQLFASTLGTIKRMLKLEPGG
jgi:predicted transcriptional regulator